LSWPRSIRFAIATFAFAGQQRHHAHLAQIQAHRVIRFFERAGREIQFYVFVYRFVIVVGDADCSLFEKPLIRISDGNIRTFEFLQNVFDIVRRNHIVWQLSIQIVESQIFLVAAQL
jgi:hypothetical protein